jgi:hypothetical protein
VGTGANLRLMLVGRDQTGAVAVSVQTAPGGAFGAWTALPNGEMVDYPAAAVARDGSVMILTIGSSGRLRVNQQTPDGKFKGWQTVGS